MVKPSDILDICRDALGSHGIRFGLRRDEDRRVIGVTMRAHRGLVTTEIIICPQDDAEQINASLVQGIEAGDHFYQAHRRIWDGQG